MTNADPSPVPLPPAPLPPVPPMPVRVIGYASGETLPVATTGTRVLLGFLAALHLLVGGPAALWILAVAVRTAVGGDLDPPALAWALFGALLAGADITCGVWLTLRRPWMWRALHVTLAILCVLQLIAVGIGAGLIVAFKHTQGWDVLALALGVILFVAASVLFWLHALAKLTLLRPNVRRAFVLDDPWLHGLHRVGTVVMMLLYGLVVLVASIWFALR